jgi:hypothetical protein
LAACQGSNIGAASSCFIPPFSGGTEEITIETHGLGMIISLPEITVFAFASNCHLRVFAVSTTNNIDTVAGIFNVQHSHG